MSTNWIIPSEINLNDCKRNFKEFVIRALNEDEKPEAMQLIMEALFTNRDDPIISALKFDAMSKDSLERWIMLHLNQNIVFGCFLKEKDLEQQKLVAVDVLYVRNGCYKFPEPSEDSGGAFETLMTFIEKIEQRIWSVGLNKRRNIRITDILTSFGVFTSEEKFKNEGIPKEMIKNRRKLAQLLRIKILGAAFIGKSEKQAMAEANTYKNYVYEFKSKHSQALGLGNIAAKDVETVFPITILGAKINLKNVYPSIADKLELHFSDVPKNFNVVYINAQSIPKHHYEMLANLYSKNIHAILVSESWLKSRHPSPSYFLPGFQLIRNDRVSDNEVRGGGVAIYLRENINYSKIDESLQPRPENAGEHLFLEVILNDVKVLMGVYYCPSKDIDYFRSFKEILEKLKPSYSHTIIMGDFNTCLLKDDWRSSTLKSIVESSNLSILRLNATHHKPNSEVSLLDLIIVSSPEHVNKHGQILADMFSYHDLLYLSYEIRPLLIDKECSNDKCKKKFDLACLEINIDTFKAHTQAQAYKKNWVCPECICSKPKRGNSETPVSTNTPEMTITTPMNNVNIQREIQVNFSPIIINTDSLSLEELRESRSDVLARMDSQANAISLLLNQFSQTKTELDNVNKIMTVLEEKEVTKLSQDRQTRKITTEISDNFPSTSTFVEVEVEGGTCITSKTTNITNPIEAEEPTNAQNEDDECNTNPIETKEPINVQKEDNECITKPIKTKEQINVLKDNNECITNPIETKGPINAQAEDNDCITTPIETKEPINVQKEDNECITKPIEATGPINIQKDNKECISNPIKTKEPINIQKEDNECISKSIEGTVPINVQKDNNECITNPIETKEPIDEQKDNNECITKPIEATGPINIQKDNKECITNPIKTKEPINVQKEDNESNTNPIKTKEPINAQKEDNEFITNPIETEEPIDIQREDNECITKPIELKEPINAQKDNNECITHPIKTKEPINVQKDNNECITNSIETKEHIDEQKEDNECITNSINTKEPINVQREDNKCITKPFSKPIEVKEPINAQKEDNECITKPIEVKEPINAQKDNNACITKPIKVREPVNAQKEDNECMTNPIETKEPIDEQKEVNECITNPIGAKEPINVQKEDNEYISKPTEAKEPINAQKEDNECIFKSIEAKEPINVQKKDNEFITNPIETKEPIDVQKEDNECITNPIETKKRIDVQKEDNECITKPIEAAESIIAQKEDNECITNPIKNKEPINAQNEDKEFITKPIEATGLINVQKDNNECITNPIETKEPMNAQIEDNESSWTIV